MDVWHRISFNASSKPTFLEFFDSLDLPRKTIELPAGGGLMIFIDITESDPRWQMVSEYLTLNGAMASRRETFFTDEEIRNAKWLRLISSFEQGYPQPINQWPIKQSSYENVCPKCGIYKQTKSMRLPKEPSLGRKSFMSLIGVGEIFCTPTVIQEFGKLPAYGYESWDAVIHKTGMPSERVRQLFIPGIASPGVIIDNNLGRNNCPVCGITKYYPHMKGIMYIQKNALLKDVDFMLTDEWFGSGLIAYREILISNRIARLILENNWKGIRMKVVELQ